MEIKKNEIKLIVNDESVGGYNVTGHNKDKIIFTFSKKPSSIHRFFCRLLLGWKWEDFD